MAPSLQRDAVPAAPIQKVIEKAILQAENDQEVARLIWPDSDDSSSSRNLCRIRSQQTVSFDLADRILCRLHQAHLWHEDPELQEVYQSIDLNWLDFSSPTCPEVAEQNLALVRDAHEQAGTLYGAAIKLCLPAQTVSRLLAA